MEFQLDPASAGVSYIISRVIAIVHGAYYAVTGLWPLLHYSSFELITGAKTDVWLVKTVGHVLFLLGMAMLLMRNRMHTSSILLVVAVAAGLVIADLLYFTTGVLNASYAIDAFVQLLLIGGWIVALFTRNRYKNHPASKNHL